MKMKVHVSENFLKIYMVVSGQEASQVHSKEKVFIPTEGKCISDRIESVAFRIFLIPELFSKLIWEQKNLTFFKNQKN